MCTNFLKITYTKYIHTYTKKNHQDEKLDTAVKLNHTNKKIIQRNEIIHTKNHTGKNIIYANRIIHTKKSWR